MGEQYYSVFDIETNKLINPDELLSIGTIILPVGGGAPERYSFCNRAGYDGSIKDGVRLLLGARSLIGHNIISFDARPSIGSPR
jgi:hypothetical protein